MSKTPIFALCVPTGITSIKGKIFADKLIRAAKHGTRYMGTVLHAILGTQVVPIKKCASQFHPLLVQGPQQVAVLNLLEMFAHFVPIVLSLIMVCAFQ